MKGKKARFFCDGCGTEVDSGAERCPLCGRYFAAIRCPRCGFSGETPAFSNGCPSCGYSAASQIPSKRRKSRLGPRRSPYGGPSWPWLHAICVAILALLLTFLLIHLSR